jgi:hypothetical protein
VVQTLLAVFGLLLALSACGGGDTDTADTTANLPVHYLRGFTVQGLEYSAQGTTGSGTTDGLGGYRTDAAEVRLNIGALTFGTVPVSDVVTLLSLPGGWSYQSKVLRLLIALDEDGDASNGITLNAALRARAQQWHYDLTTTDVESVFAAISADVAAANSRTPELPSEQVALLQFAPAFRCVYTGLYAGTMSSLSESPEYVLGTVYVDSNFAIAVSAPFGDVYGQRVSDTNDNHPPIVSDLISTAPLTVEAQPQFDTPAEPAEVEYSGLFPSTDSVRGGFGQKGAPPGIGFRGNFKGTRLAGAPDTRYRFVTNFTLPTGPQLLMLDIGAQSQTTATLASTDGQQVTTLVGTLQANVLNVSSAGTRYQLTGTLERTALAITGKFTDHASGAVVTFTAENPLNGCAP